MCTIGSSSEEIDRKKQYETTNALQKWNFTYLIRPKNTINN